MRRTLVAYTVVALLSLAFAGAAFAADPAQPVVQNLESTFNVTADQISSLQAEGLGYGEIAIVFSLAGNMTGGITSTNIATIMGMRQGSPPMGWGQIARSLGLNLGTVVSQAERVRGADVSSAADQGGMSASAGAGSQGESASDGHMSSAGSGHGGGRGGR